jgi:hypothetical protein
VAARTDLTQLYFSDGGDVRSGLQYADAIALEARTFVLVNTYIVDGHLPQSLRRQIKRSVDHSILSLMPLDPTGAQVDLPLVPITRREPILPLAYRSARLGGDIVVAWLTEVIPHHIGLARIRP